MNRTVKRIIDEWDPIDLLIHAPKNEYDTESDLISQIIQIRSDINFIAIMIHAVFTYSFGEDTFRKSIGDCRSVAEKIYKLTE